MLAVCNKPETKELILMPRYNAEISAGSLMLLESRKIAALLITNPNDAEWEGGPYREKIVVDWRARLIPCFRLNCKLFFNQETHWLNY